MKVLIFSLLLATASCNLLDEIVGRNWTTVMVFPMIPINKMDCPGNTFAIETTNETCTCGGKVVPVVKMSSPLHTDKGGVFTVTTHDEVEKALQEDCSTCSYKDQLVFRFINDNYILMYKESVGSSLFMMMAKEIPAYAEIDKMAKSIDVTKNVMGIPVCTNETKNEV